MLARSIPTPPSRPRYRARMSNRRAMLTMTALHRAIVRLTGGRLGWSIGEMRVIELETVGRRSGERRRAMLTVPVEEGDRLVVIASRGGDDAMPAWYLNLQAEPRVGVAEQGGAARPYRARTADPQERERLWPRAVAAYRGYAAYQRRTERLIPVVILEPESPAAPA